MTAFERLDARTQLALLMDRMRFRPANAPDSELDLMATCRRYASATYDGTWASFDRAACAVLERCDARALTAVLTALLRPDTYARLFLQEWGSIVLRDAPRNCAVLWNAAHPSGRCCVFNCLDIEQSAAAAKPARSWCRTMLCVAAAAAAAAVTVTAIALHKYI